jgi:hypothetical protein
MKTGRLSVIHGVAHRNSPSIAPTATACQPESNDDNYETQRRHTSCYRATVGAQLEVSVRVPNFARRRQNGTGESDQQRTIDV